MAQNKNLSKGSEDTDLKFEYLGEGNREDGNNKAEREYRSPEEATEDALWYIGVFWEHLAKRKEKA